LRAFTSSTGLESIRAADAYALGFTGKGVTGSFQVKLEF
jgi:hypothetical protein